MKRILLSAFGGLSFLVSIQTQAAPEAAPSPTPPALSRDQQCARIGMGLNPDLNGFVPFSADNPWNLDMSKAPADPDSSAKINGYIGRIGNNPPLLGDFGEIYGETFNVVDSSKDYKQMVTIDGYPDESDLMPVPLPNTAAVEGGRQSCFPGNDCHLLILDRNGCWLYETWQTRFDGESWKASNLAVWDFLNGNSRPFGWTSADAAGLAVLPGLVRYDEVSRGVIEHAIRLTLSTSANSFVAPATHLAGKGTLNFPMGTRFRLKADFDISQFSPIDQVILTAMKKYGIILADNGLELEVSGVYDPRWLNSDVNGLLQVHLTDFEVLQSGPQFTWSTIPKGPAPEIQEFTASSLTVDPGTPVTLVWTQDPTASYFIDVIGPVRGNSIVVTPTQTTTYTLNATNAYGRAFQKVTVVVRDKTQIHNP